MISFLEVLTHLTNFDRAWQQVAANQGCAGGDGESIDRLNTYTNIPDDKCRLRLANFLEGYGRRVQYSVFECFMDMEEMQELHKKVEKLINPVEDNVRFYWLTPEAVKNSLTLGSPPPQEPPNLYIF